MTKCPFDEFLKLHAGHSRENPGDKIIPSPAMTFIMEGSVPTMLGIAEDVSQIDMRIVTHFCAHS